MKRTKVNNDKANAELNAGRSSAWPEWKNRLFSSTSQILWDLGFRRSEYNSADLKRIQGGIACVISPPNNSYTSGRMTMYYLDANLGSTTCAIDEDLAGRIAAGWSNSDLLADDGLNMPSMVGPARKGRNVISPQASKALRGRMYAGR